MATRTPNTRARTQLAKTPVYSNQINLAALTSSVSRAIKSTPGNQIALASEPVKTIKDIVDTANSEGCNEESVVQALDEISKLLTASGSHPSSMANHLKQLANSFHLIALTWQASGQLMNILIKISWPSVVFGDESGEVVEALVQLIFECISLDVGSLDKVLKRIVCPLLQGTQRAVDEDSKSDIEMTVFRKMFDLIEEVSASIPRTAEEIFSTIKTTFPYHVTNKPHNYLCYLFNVLQLSHLPQFKDRAILAALDKLLWLDLNCHNRHRVEDVFQMDLDTSGADSAEDQQLVLALTGKAISEIISWIEKQIISERGVDEQKSLELFRLIFPAFKRTIMASEGSSSAQFVVFYLASQSEQLADEFVDGLWNLIVSEKAPRPLRMMAINYSASFLVRSKAIDHEVIIDWICGSLGWATNYVNQFNSEPSSELVVEVAKHDVFYRLFQSVVYLIVIKGHSLGEDAFKQFRLLNVQKLITSRLNPLAVCCEQLADKFAGLSRHYQLALCSSVIERNRRMIKDADLLIDSTFGRLPFDTIKVVSDGRFDEVWPLYNDDVPKLSEESSSRARFANYENYASSVSPSDVKGFMMNLSKSNFLTDLSDTEEEAATLLVPMDISI